MCKDLWIQDFDHKAAAASGRPEGAAIEQALQVPQRSRTEL
jgi:hypothetical protein